MSQNKSQKKSGGDRKHDRNYRVFDGTHYTLAKETRYVSSGGPARAAKRTARNIAKREALHIRHEGKMTLRNQQRSTMFWLDRSLALQQAAEHIYPLK